MSEIIVHELKTELKQRIKPTINGLINTIRPHLYKHNAPAGTLKLEVRDTNDKKIGESSTVAISAISAVAFFHGYIQFPITVPLRRNVEYDIVLTVTGYTFAESAYVGWVNDSGGLLKYSTDFTQGGSFNRALDMEIWVRRDIARA